MTEQIRFTKRVLGWPAYERLERHKVTQTLRSPRTLPMRSPEHDSSPVKVKVGDPVHIALDGKVLGRARIISMDLVLGKKLNVIDAQRGGFDHVDELEAALHRAGFRFRGLYDYFFTRVQFEWQDLGGAAVPAVPGPLVRQMELGQAAL